MFFQVIIIIGIVIANWIMWSKYNRSKKLITSAKESVYPKMEEDIPMLYTAKGKVERLGFDTKGWKTKRWIVWITTSLFIVFVALTIFTEQLSWENLLIFIYIPILNSFTTIVPMFFVSSLGIYHDEVYYEWGIIRGFTVSPVLIGSDAYGMFKDSPSYTEIKIELTKAKPSYISVYVLEKAEVEKITSILKQFEVKELEKEAKKQLNQ